jgi:DNA-binding HxlR family transcriptional regulator
MRAEENTSPDSFVDISMLEMQMNHLDQALDEGVEGPVRMAAGSLSFFLASHPEEYSVGVRWLEERIVLASGRTLAYLEGVRDALAGARAAVEADLKLRKLGILARGPRLRVILEALASAPQDSSALAVRLHRQETPLLLKDLSVLEHAGLIKQELEQPDSDRGMYMITITGHTVIERLQKEQANLA